MVATVEPAPGTDGRSAALDGELYLLATRSVQLPWAVLAGASASDPFRVRVALGARRLTAVAGDFHEMTVRRYEIRPLPGGTERAVVDDGGARVWTFAAESYDAAVDAIVGRAESVWLRWEGTEFVEADAPWRRTDGVETVGTGRGVFARSFDPAGSTTGLWYTPDGRSWATVELPDLPGDEEATAIHEGAGDVIVAIRTSGGFANWSTRDGTSFDRLPDVPGITARSVGAFGTVAADPRGLPLLRVSTAGSPWEEIDIGALLDREGGPPARLTTSIVDDTIFVTTTGAGRRTMLIGVITPLGGDG